MKEYQDSLFKKAGIFFQLFIDKKVDFQMGGITTSLDGEKRQDEYLTSSLLKKHPKEFYRRLKKNGSKRD